MEYRYFSINIPDNNEYLREKRVQKDSLQKGGDTYDREVE